MKTTIDIADSLFAQVKEQAAAEGTSFRAIVEEGLRLALGKRREAATFVLRDRSVAGRGLQRGQSWELPRELAYEDPLR